MASDPPLQATNWTFRRIVWATFVLILVALGFWLFYRFYQVVFILLIAIVIGTVIRPAVKWLQRRGFSPTLGVILVFFLLLVFLIGFVLLLFPLIVEQGTTIVAAVPVYYQNLRDWMSNSTNSWMIRLNELLPETLIDLEPVQQTGPQTLASAEQAWGYVVSAANTIFISIVMLLLIFHWTLDGPQIIHSLLQRIPKIQRESIGELVSAMETKVGYFLAGQGVLCLVIGILALVAYLLIGLPNALVLALVAGLLEAVPMVGPLLGAIPAALVALSIAPSKLVWVIIATVIIQLLENNLLVPRVMRKAVGVNPFVSLLAIFAFSSLFGIAGALMAIPLAAILQLLLDRFVFHPSAMEPEPFAGRDLASRLHYEAQDLAQDLRKQARLKKRGSDQVVRQINRTMDEIESIATDLDVLLSQVNSSGDQ